MADNDIRDQLHRLLRQHISYDHQAAAVDALLAEGWRPPARVIDTTEIEAMPTGTLLRSADGDVASVDHGGDGEWLGGDTKVHFLGFVTRWWEFVIHLPANQWTVLWQPEVDHA
ncbi:hypothetical protein [Nocardia sp. NPDC004711]